MDSTDDLLAELLDLPPEQWRAGLERVCTEHPACATELRRRFAHLERCGVTEPVALSAPVPGQVPQRFGSYRLLRRLGEGGMGTVWLALHEGLGREVAIKMLRPERLWFDNARERFQREVEAVARLRHPGCVAIQEVGETESVPFFAMEYVAGANCEQILTALRARRPAVSPASSSGHDLLTVLRQGGAQVDSGASALFAGPWTRTAVRIVLAATEALAHAHARGVVHRDLKPGNVMVTPEGRVVVIDFGLAVAAGTSALTREGSQLGSVPYMAPEQLRGDAAAIGPRTDVYALGVCLYELLAMAPAFAPGDEQQLRTAILAGSVPPLTERNAAVSRDLAVVVARAMHVDPERRYASALELAADLMAVLEDRSIQARRDALGARLSRWARQRPALATAAALLLLGTLLVPTAISLAIAGQRDRAQVAEQQARRREYGASVSAAATALLAGNGNAARLLLDGCAPELRGFEWHHLQLAVDTSFLVMPTGSAAVTAVAVTPAGDRLMAGTADGRLRLYALAAGELLREFKAVGKSALATIAFDGNGAELYAVDAEQALRVYDVSTGQLLRQRPGAASKERLSLPDPVDRVVVARPGGRLTILDARSLAVLRDVDLELRGWPDDNPCVVSGEDVLAGGKRGITIWDSRDGSCRAQLPHAAGTKLLGVSEGATMIASLHGPDLMAWHLGEQRGSSFSLGGRTPIKVLLPRAGRFVVAPCDTGEILVRDPETQHVRTLCGHRGAVTSAAIVPRTNTFVTGGADGTVRLWSASASRDRVELTGVGWGRSLAIDAQRRLFTGGEDATVRAVDPDTGAVAWQALHPHWVNAVAVVEAEQLLVASVGTRLWFWSTADGTSRGHLDLPADSSRAMRIAVAPGGGLLAVGGLTGHVTLVDPVARTVLQSRAVHAGMLTEIVFAEPRRLLSGGSDGAVFAMDAAGEAPPQLLCRTSVACRSIALAGAVLYTSEQALGAPNGVLVERDARTGAARRSQAVSDAVVVMRVLDDQRLVVGTVKGHVVVWDRELLTPILDLKLFTGLVRNLVVDPRGEWVAATGAGGDPKILRAVAGIGIGDPRRVHERLQVADLRDRIGAAELPVPWRPHVERALAADSDLTPAVRELARSLLPPATPWGIGNRALDLGTGAAPSAADRTWMRELFAALQEALAAGCDEHEQLARIGCALLAVRLGEPQAALHACGDLVVAATEPTDDAGHFLLLLHFVRGMAHGQLGDRTAAQRERTALAALVAGAFAADSVAHRLLRELDEALR
jgi:serine/threonine protein kinase/WD40 repeat protein